MHFSFDLVKLQFETSTLLFNVIMQCQHQHQAKHMINVSCMARTNGWSYSRHLFTCKHQLNKPYFLTHFLNYKVYVYLFITLEI